ncbi:penicillin-binding protein activator LpoB [Phaeodactylibacter luteus]|uniref:Penicillin-binding protein activator LpoB n=1 Tax=Phaeodactylibacter luteus TaxID=1564516 RepID=A0A5C6RKA7_9BACT|nr:penicillin-binding protein activator LpoB [Phaeodactylibacter luteus]TXB62414.1 penicillin-binding protein activator LpoB [Phaeodactylibacter luteus]
MKPLFPLLFLALLLGTSCNRKIQRIDTDTTVDLSGRWNDTDARLTAAELVTEIMGQPWLGRHTRENNGEEPVVIVGMVENKSHEHIESEVFTKELEKAFVKSGRVRLVQGGAKREQVRRERADQQTNASQSTMKKWGLEVGADYMLQGSINSIMDAYKREKVIYYQIDMTLTHMETNEVVWIGDKKIKKFVKN